MAIPSIGWLSGIAVGARRAWLCAEGVWRWLNEPRDPLLPKLQTSVRRVRSPRSWLGRIVVVAVALIALWGVASAGLRVAYWYQAEETDKEGTTPTYP